MINLIFQLLEVPLLLDQCEDASEVLCKGDQRYAVFAFDAIFVIVQNGLKGLADSLHVLDHRLRLYVALVHEEDEIAVDMLETLSKDLKALKLASFSGV